jgi:hypothetical protein
MFGYRGVSLDEIGKHAARNILKTAGQQVAVRAVRGN